MQCLALSVEGGVCDGGINQGCAPGHYCDTQNDVCHALRNVGGTCDIDWGQGCLEGLYCSAWDALCYEKLADSENCWDDEECQSNDCYGTTPPGTCVSQCGAP